MMWLVKSLYPLITLMEVEAQRAAHARLLCIVWVCLAHSRGAIQKLPPRLLLLKPLTCLYRSLRHRYTVLYQNAGRFVNVTRALSLQAALTELHLKKVNKPQSSPDQCISFLTLILHDFDLCKCLRTYSTLSLLNCLLDYFHISLFVLVTWWHWVIFL